MKNFMYFLPLAALAMASCTNDDSPAAIQAGNELAKQVGDQLVMRPIIQGASTRVVTAYDNQSLTQFHIDIQGQFTDGEDGATVTAIHENLNSNNGWALKSAGDNLYYWADAVSSGYFSAFAPATGIANGQVYAVDQDRANQLDPIVAYNEGVKSDFKNGVPLTFRHATSQIQVMALNKDAGKIDIHVKAMRLVNIKSQATMTMPTVSTSASSFAWSKGDIEGNGRVWPWADDLNTELTYSAEGDQLTLPINATSITFGDNYYFIPQLLTNAIISTDEAAADWDAKYDFASGNALEMLIQVKDFDTKKAIAPVLQGSYVKLTSSDTYDGSETYYVQVPAADDKYSYSEKAISSSDDFTSALSSGLYKFVATAEQGYMWVYVNLDTDWFPGKQYIYTLNFAEDAYGMVSPNQIPGGTPDPMDPTPDDSADDDPEEPEPSDPVIENPVPLTFQVQVIDWDKVDNQLTNL